MMSWLQIGMAKSGNFWVHTLLTEVRKAAKIETTSYIQQDPIYPVAKKWQLSFENQADIDTLMISNHQAFSRISSIYNMPIDNMEDYAKKASLVWLHSPYVARTTDVLKHFEKIIYIVRDPRDITLSSSRYEFTPYRLKHYAHSEENEERFLNRHFLSNMETWINHTTAYLSRSSELNIHVLYYENLLNGFDAEFKRLLTYLGLELTNEQYEHIKETVSFDHMKKNNSAHLKKGKSSQWIEKLSKRNKRICKIVAGPMLNHLGYPVIDSARNEENLILPPFKGISPKLLKRMQFRITLIKRLRALFQIKKVFKPS